VGPTTLDAIAARIRACRLCGLCEGRANAVPGEGTGRLRLMLVGEAPGRKEDESGRPFVGAAGRNLDLALAAAGIERKDAFITSIVKCRPPGNRDPTPEEKEACRVHLMEQVDALQPRVIVALGRHGLHGLLGHMPAGFAALPGTFLAGPNGIPVWVSLHPAAVIYRQRWKPRFLEQWKEFGDWFRSGRPAPVAKGPGPG
jgi:uracil-DNA glycosylase